MKIPSWAGTTLVSNMAKISFKKWELVYLSINWITLDQNPSPSHLIWWHHILFWTDTWKVLIRRLIDKHNFYIIHSLLTTSVKSSKNKVQKVRTSLLINHLNPTWPAPFNPTCDMVKPYSILNKIDWKLLSRTLIVKHNFYIIY